MKYPAYVYVLFNSTPKYYVGLSANPKARFARHKSLLQAGKHPVEDMQADYNASQEKLLTYAVLDTVNSEGERWKEHKWQVKLRSYEREYGYNYKDPTARTEMGAAEQKKRVKETLKKRIRSVVYAQGEVPIPLSEKRRAEREKAMAEFLAMSETEFNELLDCIRMGYI